MNDTGDIRGFWLRATTMIAAIFVVLTQVACVAHSDRMHPVATSDVAPDPAAAKLVFLRPSRLGGAIVVTIIDQKGRYLGESEADSNFTVRMPPGDYVLASWSESTPAMRASLAAGRVYYVLVDPEMGWGSARVQLIALTQRNPDSSRIEEWLRSTRPIAADEAAGQVYVQGRGDDARERLAAAAKHLTEYDASDLERRTLRAEDGTGSGAAAAPPAVAAVAAPPAGAAPQSPVVAAAVAVPLAPASPAATAARRPPGDDLVLLKNGGRVRGKVMEDEPVGVSIKLLDGTTRRIPRAEIDHVDFGQ